MPDVYELAAQFRADLIARDDAARRRLVAAYFSAYKRLAAELAVLTSQIEEARAAGVIFSPSWLYRQDRYQQLIAQLIREITALSRDAADLIEARQAEEVARGVRDAAGLATAQIAASSVGASFTQLPVTALEYLVGTLGDGSPLMDRLKHLPESAREDVRRALTEGLAEGAGPSQMARRMRQALGGNLDRALTIARTESLRAYRQAQIASYQANRDLITEWEWSCSFSRRTCLNCLALDGKLFPLERPMPAHPNCIPAGAVINSPEIQLATSRFYVGEIVELVTSTKRLSVTPNHPILTDRGWIAAGLLNESDSIVCTDFPERMLARVDPNKDHAPSRIEEIFKAASKRSGVLAHSMPSAPEYFHGDGKGSDVKIIDMYGLLGDRLNASILEPFIDHYLCGRCITMPGLANNRALSFLFNGLNSSPSGVMRGLAVSHSLFRRPLRSHQPVGFDLISDWNIGFSQSAADNVAANVQMIGNAFFRSPAVVHVNDQFNGESFSDGVYQRQPVSGDDSIDNLMRDTKMGADLLTGMAGIIHFENLREICRKDFSGHVYNLQTSEQWYVANGIITHNCRCTTIPRIKALPPLKRQTGAEWFAAQPDAVQKEMMGPRAFAEYKAGRVAIEDFQGEKTSPQWGTMTFQRSLISIQAGTDAPTWTRGTLRAP